MKKLRSVLDSCEKHFEKGPLKKFYPIYEMIDTFLFTPLRTTSGSVHLADATDLKRVMITVVVALIPCILIGIYNTGLQTNVALSLMGHGAITSALEGSRGSILSALGIGLDPHSCLSNFALGLSYFLPIYIVTQVVGGFWEVLFAVVRKHEINEGFLVTGTLFPLILPASIPLWQVALGVSFGVVFGKEVFGGTGKNFLNTALVGRAFLFFAYPGQMSGAFVWTAADGFSGATALGNLASGGVSAVTNSFNTMLSYMPTNSSWLNAFLGFIPGSIGETSALGCIFGAIVLIISGVGSWRTIFSSIISFVLFITLFHATGSATASYSMGAAWHLVVGGYLFGTVFMATDPVSSAQTFKGQFFYGALIGFMVALVRVVNPAFPEGTMLAILFANCLAPLIDYFVIKNHIKRKMKKRDVSYAA